VCFRADRARAARRDPLAFRLDLARREHPPSAGVLEAVADMSGWSGETPAGIGRGVAMVYGYGTAVAVVIEVSDRDGAVSIDRAWMACDVGRALDPAIIEAQMTSGLIFGLSAAVMQDITFQDGVVQQGNFPDFDALRLHQAPRIALRVLETQDAIGGVGEPGTPPAAPALANAIHDLMGERIRHLPLNRTVDFVI
jgi:isoquinoline 1-oxidoreductase beta subunit